LDTFRRLTRDLYIPVGDIYFWQGGIRDPADHDRPLLADKVSSQARIVVDVIYADQQGGQRVVSRLGLGTRDDGTYLVTLPRQWNVDRPDPRASRAYQYASGSR
jgi:hypothetical protein